MDILNPHQTGLLSIMLLLLQEQNWIEYLTNSVIQVTAKQSKNSSLDKGFPIEMSEMHKTLC